MAKISDTTDLQAHKREKILQAAQERLLQYGVSKTTIQDIASDVSLTAPAIYQYFKNKDEIVLAIAHDRRRKQEEEQQRILNHPNMTASQKLEQFMVARFTHLNSVRTETPHGRELVEYLINRYPELLSQWRTQFEAHIASILKQGVRQGTWNIADIDQSARILGIATAGFFVPPHIDLPQKPSQEELMVLIRWFVHLWEKTS